jgi:opacity protein-like surface antigen
MFKKLLATSAILATCSTMVFANGAPYLGASLGVTNNTADSGGSFRGVPLTLSAGYGMTLNQFVYLGGEIVGTVGTSTLNNVAIGESLKTTYGYGIGFIPGVMLSDHAMAFMRLAAVRARFSSIGDTTTGGQIGLGMQTSITQNWDLRGEYDYTSYRSISGISPRSDTFNLGVVYKFE